MEKEESIKITLTSKDIESIISEHVSKIMESGGYQLALMKSNEGPIPDLVFKGLKVENA